MFLQGHKLQTLMHVHKHSCVCRLAPWINRTRKLGVFHVWTNSVHLCCNRLQEEMEKYNTLDVTLLVKLATTLTSHQNNLTKQSVVVDVLLAPMATGATLPLTAAQRSQSHRTCHSITSDNWMLLPKSHKTLCVLAKKYSSWLSSYIHSSNSLYNAQTIIRNGHGFGLLKICLSFISISL